MHLKYHFKRGSIAGKCVPNGNIRPQLPILTNLNTYSKMKNDSTEHSISLKNRHRVALFTLNKGSYA